MALNLSTKQELSAVLRAVGRVNVDEPMAHHTSYHIGGPADLFLRVNSRQGLMDAISCSLEYEVPVLVIGAGSNLLVSDRGISGLVVENRSRGWEWLGEREGPARSGCPQGDVVVEAVRVEVGIPLSRIAGLTADRGLAGFEWSAGIPGTVGGAIVNNAGAHGTAMADILDSVLILEDGKVKTVLASDLGFAYRQSILKGMKTDKLVKPVIVEGVFLLRHGLAENIRLRLNEYREGRRSTQPQLPSAGSVFRNPPGNVGAGWLIEQCGLKGEQRGDARISEVHANFIVNCGHATAEDVRCLIDHAMSRVFDRFGVKLELEQEIIGDW
ncbi:MAG: UDP-N-acetylmuramate dehydrogenase [Dehalococcoidia bacterium]|nr:UDP-N-acetylmuramate dehydrogenase [Dehalococcoidia bacterium]